MTQEEVALQVRKTYASILEDLSKTDSDPNAIVDGILNGLRHVTAHTLYSVMANVKKGHDIEQIKMDILGLFLDDLCEDIKNLFKKDNEEN